MSIMTNKLMQMYWAQQQNAQPYAEVLEYIHLDGTQYYDIGLMTTNEYTFECRFTVDSDATASCSIYGGRDNNSAQSQNGVQLHWIYNDGRLQYINGYGAQQYQTVTVPGVDITYENNSSGYIINGTQYNTATFTAIQNPKAIYLGITNTNGTLQFPLKGLIRYFKVKQNGTLIRDYVPVLDKDFQPCLYDRVKKKLLYHTNISGSIAPTYKRWNKYTVDYLESSGTQYIDTGVIINDHTMLARIQCPEYVNNTALFGVWSKASSPYVCAHLTLYTNRWYFGVGGTTETSIAFPYSESYLDWHWYSIDTRGQFKQDNIPLKVVENTPNNSQLTCYVYARHTLNAGSLCASSIRCSSFVIIDNVTNTKVRSFVPTVYDSQACMYDECYNKMYYNAGTGTFTYGIKYKGEEYKPVEYLESSGTQKIVAVTGEVDDSYGMDAVFSMDYSSDNYPAGFSTTNNRRFLFWGTYLQAWAYGWYTASTSSTSPTYPYADYPYGLDNYYHATMNYMNTGKCSFADNDPADMTAYGTSFTNTDFVLYNTIKSGVTARFKRAVISKGDAIIRYLIPVVRSSDGKPGMFDLCGSKCPLTNTPFYINAGTGEFTTPE